MGITNDAPATFIHVTDIRPIDQLKVAVKMIQNDRSHPVDADQESADRFRKSLDKRRHGRRHPSVRF